MRAAVVGLALLACGGSAEQVLAPVIDTPDPAVEAYPYTEIDALVLSIARAGDAIPLASRTVGRGEAPVLGDVPFGDDLVVHLSGTRAGIEIAYGRSCAVDVARGAALAEPHVFFSRFVKWAPGPTPLQPGRRGAAAYATPRGEAVFVGGEGDEAAVERFAPLEARFVAGGAGVARRGAVVAPLADERGRALRIGGLVGDVAAESFELLTPLEGRVEQVPAEGSGMIDHAAATLVDGSVVVMGGRAPDAGGALQVSGATWIFKLGAADAPEQPRLLPARLATPRAKHTATRLGDELGAAVLVIGGLDAAGNVVATAELYEPLRESYAAFAPVMQRPRYDHRVVRLPDGSLLIVGGRDAAMQPVDTIEIYRPRVGQFTIAATLPARAGLTELSASPLPDGRVLLAGGRDRGGAPVSATFFASLDPIDGMIDLPPTDSLAAPRAGHAAALLCDGTVLVVGGADDASAPPSERYNPPAAGRR